MALPAIRHSAPVERGNPFREFEDVYSQMGRLMESLVGPVESRAWSPMADVSETEDAYVVEVEVPGVKRRDIQVDLSGQELTISGERKETEREGWFRRHTRRVGEFHYSLTLPQDVQADKIEANLADGVLTVRVPKNESTQRRRITVSGG